MLKIITLPQVELNLENAKVVEIRVSLGDRLGPQDVLLSVETQKAVEDLPCGESGFLRALLVKVGDEVSVHDRLAVLTDGADEAYVMPDLKADLGATLKPQANLDNTADLAAASKTEERIRAVPVARKRAKELGVDLSKVTGSGPNGRISCEDVESFASTSGQAGASSAVLSARRRALIAQMEAGCREIPQISISRYMDVTRIALREEGTTFTSRLTHRVGCALQAHKSLRSYLERGEMHTGPVDVAVAMDSRSGLVAPVLRGVDRMSVEEVSLKLADLRRRAEENRLASDELKDGRFAVTNLGMLGVDLFTPLVFAGQTAVLAVGRTNDANGKPSAWFTLAADHRIVDGAEAARFLESLQGAIAARSP